MCVKFKLRMYFSEPGTLLIPCISYSFKTENKIDPKQQSQQLLWDLSSWPGGGHRTYPAGTPGFCCWEAFTVALPWAQGPRLPQDGRPGPQTKLCLSKQPFPALKSEEAHGIDCSPMKSMRCQDGKQGLSVRIYQIACCALLLQPHECTQPNQGTREPGKVGGAYRRVTSCDNFVERHRWGKRGKYTGICGLLLTTAIF